MTDPTDDNRESQEADGVGERPDHGRMQDALIDAVSGSGMGSDTRAGSLQGGAASGSDADPAQVEVDRVMADEGRSEADPQSGSGVDPDPIANTGVGPDEAADPAEGKRDPEADAATG
ncbi:ribonuclease [Brevundimonas sp. LM2]|uniref:ribonuclease n=1 Tax=Brevundimonas sp. LM2 TaxID=1938605 RepID=UPI001C0AE9D9|nr:ribonuclease [Brevundimonas sp. LM2]